MPEWLENMLQRYDLLLLGVLLAIPIVIGGVLTGLTRLYAYAAFTILVILTGIALAHRCPLLFHIPGSGYFGCGHYPADPFFAHVPVGKRSAVSD